MEESFGTFDNNPALNTLANNFEFPDGSVKQYSSNVIAMNILSQIYYDGHD